MAVSTRSLSSSWPSPVARAAERFPRGQRPIPPPPFGIVETRIEEFSSCQFFNRFSQKMVDQAVNGYAHTMRIPSRFSPANNFHPAFPVLYLAEDHQVALCEVGAQANLMSQIRGK